MKKLYIILAAAMAFAAVSCDRTNPYKGEGAFVTFGSGSSLTYSEAAGTFTLPIRAVGEHGAFSATVAGVDGTAISGQHYQIIEPANGVVQFEAADTVKYVTVKLNKVEGYVDPGRWTFDVNIDNATGGVGRGARRTVSVTITDADHPLNAFIGSWTATVTANWGDVYVFDLKVQADANDITKLWFYDLCAYMGGNGYHGPAYGTCSDDLMSITIPKGQSTGYYASNYGENVVYWGLGDTDIVFVDNGDGTISTTGGWGSHISLGWFELYPNAVTFTRK